MVDHLVTAGKDIDVIQKLDLSAQKGPVLIVVGAGHDKDA